MCLYVCVYVCVCLCVCVYFKPLSLVRTAFARDAYHGVRAVACACLGLFAPEDWTRGLPDVREREEVSERVVGDWVR